MICLPSAKVTRPEMFSVIDTSARAEMPLMPMLLWPMVPSSRAVSSLTMCVLDPPSIWKRMVICPALSRALGDVEVPLASAALQT